MKKGCIIALVIFAAIVAIGVAVIFKFVIPKAQALGSSGIIVLAESAVDSYIAEYSKAPEGDHGKVLDILRGNNSKEINFLGNEIDGQVVDGKIVDAWRNPLEMTRDGDGKIRFTSAGPNGEHGDDDDVSSEGLRNLMEKIEKKAAEAEAKAEAE